MLKPVYKDVTEFICDDLYAHAVMAPAGRMIWDKCHEIAHMLIEKNISYGNSFQKPIGIFSKLPAREQTLIRIDDKLNRLASGQSFGDEDTILDLVGYLILLLVLDDKNR